MPVSFFPSAESVGRLFMDGVLKQDLSEHYQHREFHKMPGLGLGDGVRVRD